MKFYCAQCHQTEAWTTRKFRCSNCQGLFKLAKEQGDSLPDTISLGEVVTPILTRIIEQHKINFKLDYLSPTGSFKDRGAKAVVNALHSFGVTEVVEDSSGNAGAAFAGYCAAAGIKCNIYLPESTSPGKIKQIAAYGANIIKIPGNRDATAEATLQAAEKCYYASHVYNPIFYEGTKMMAYELAKQVGIPDYIFVPAGNGTMLLGTYIGFNELGKLPKIIAVQSENCAPVHAKYHGKDSLSAKDTVAEGIAVGTPLRIDEMIDAVRASKGDIITVNDDEVMTAQKMMAKMGIYTEPTSGTALAGMLQYFHGQNTEGLNIVVPLTGIGLKK